MTYYADLSPCEYFDGLPFTGRWSCHLRAVGWLERGQQFARGPVTPDLLRRLFALTEKPWEPVHCLGWHECDLCLIPRRGPQVEYLFGSPGAWVSIGIANLFVPGRGVLYVAPSMILHYISGHEYLPPAEFCDAVQACAPMDSVDYADAIVRNGPPELAIRRQDFFRT